MIGNKTADKNTLVGKTKNKEKEDETEIYIPPEKRQQIIDDLRYNIKMEYQKIINLLDPTSDNVPKFITKKWIDVYDQSGNAKDRCKPSRQVRFKTPVLQSDLCDYGYAYIVVEGTIALTDSNNANYKK